MEDRTLVDLFEAHACHSLVTRYSAVFSGFPVETRGPCGFFIVHEEYLEAVARTGCTRGDHTH